MNYPDWLRAYLQPFYDAPTARLFCAVAVGEGENQSYLGQLGICFTLRNRQRYAECALIPWFSRDHRVNALLPHQFGCFWEGWAQRAPAMERSLVAPARYYTADLAAHRCLAGYDPDPTLGADHYWVWSGKEPEWARVYPRTVRIGQHQFHNSQGV